MVDSGFPSQHTTTTTVQTSNTTVDKTIRFDKSYLRSLHGILKVVQVALNLLGFICIEASGDFRNLSRGSWFVFVAMTGFWFTGILLALYLFHIIERFHRIPWPKIELFFCALWTALYLIAASLTVSVSYPEAYIVAGVFGFLAMVAYGVDAFFKFGMVKSGQLAQGERVVKETMTTQVSTQAY